MPGDRIFYLVVLVALGLLFLAVRLWLKQRQQEDAQKTVRLSIERGMQLTPELVRSLGVRQPLSDLKRGIIDLCVAVGVVAFGVLDRIEDGAESSFLTFVAIAVFPALIGGALIVFHFIDRGRR